MGRSEAVIETVAHFTAGADSWCWLAGNRVHWTGVRFDGVGQQWRRNYALPHGVNARDVKTIIPGRATCTLFTSDAAFGLNCDTARWSAPVALFAEAS